MVMWMAFFSEQAKIDLFDLSCHEINSGGASMRLVNSRQPVILATQQSFRFGMICYRAAIVRKSNTAEPYKEIPAIRRRV
jgi:hypothetical protein